MMIPFLWGISMGFGHLLWESAWGSPLVCFCSFLWANMPSLVGALVGNGSLEVKNWVGFSGESAWHSGQSLG